MHSSNHEHSWDKRFMLLAHHITDWSKEKGRHVGSVIVDDERIIRSTGFNGMPRGVNENIESRHDSTTNQKYFWSSHAERNAIYNAARIGVSVKGCTIYIPWFPCGECAKAIIQSGICSMVAYELNYDDPRWGEDFRHVTEMLNEGGVLVRFIEPLMGLKSGL